MIAQRETCDAVQKMDRPRSWRFNRVSTVTWRPARLALACLALLFPLTGRAQVDIQGAANDHVTISINGKPFSGFYLGNAYPKPFLAPLRTAAGVIVTRRFPMEQVEGESHDHPHHKGLWIGYGDVNGINFWENEAASKTSGTNPSQKGTVRLHGVERSQSGKKSGSVRATFDWESPGGEALMKEDRTMTFYADPDVRRIDVEAVFTANTRITFADTKEGFFAIRVADSMDGKNGGILTNSEGAQTEKDVWGKQANWVDYDGTVDGQKVGIVIFDNPRNPNHPPRWHARDYGLFAVNPFGVKDFDPKAPERGGYVLEPGNSLRFRYRVIVHAGDVSKKAIGDWYTSYTKGAR